MTRIVRLHAFGGPEVLRIDEIPMPEPGAGEVRIGVHAIGLNRVEAQFRAGEFGTPLLPCKIGYEAAGVVEEIGEGVTNRTVGDRVAILPGIPMDTHGTYGEQILCPAEMLVDLPPDQPFEQAAATWMQYVTASAVREAGIGIGDAVVITAASSSVGLAAIQIVRAEGGIPIAVTRTRAKADALLGHGASHVIVTDEQDLAPAILSATGDRGAAIAFDAVAGAQVDALAAGMARGGKIVLYGALGGGTARFEVNRFMLAGLVLEGFAAFQITSDPARRAAAIGYVNSGMASGQLRPVVAATFDFDQIVEAHRYLESNAQIGKIVVRVR